MQLKNTKVDKQSHQQHCPMYKWLRASLQVPNELLKGPFLTASSSWNSCKIAIDKDCEDGPVDHSQEALETSACKKHADGTSQQYTHLWVHQHKPCFPWITYGQTSSLHMVGRSRTESFKIHNRIFINFIPLTLKIESDK